MVDRSVVESVLERLNAGLDPDGFSLRIGTLRSDDSIEVILEATPEACLECLVPEDMMVSMIRELISQGDPSVGTVELAKVGFDSIESHGS